MPRINEFDLAFVVDTTGSMDGLIAAAQQQMVDMVASLAAAIDVDMQLDIPGANSLRQSIPSGSPRGGRGLRTGSGLAAVLAPRLPGSRTLACRHRDPPLQVGAHDNA